MTKIYFYHFVTESTLKLLADALFPNQKVSFRFLNPMTGKFILWRNGALTKKAYLSVCFPLFFPKSNNVFSLKIQFNSTTWIWVYRSSIDLNLLQVRKHFSHRTKIDWWPLSTGQIILIHHYIKGAPKMMTVIF